MRQACASKSPEQEIWDQLCGRQLESAGRVKPNPPSPLNLVTRSLACFSMLGPGSPLKGPQPNTSEAKKEEKKKETYTLKLASPSASQRAGSELHCCFFLRRPKCPNSYGPHRTLLEDLLDTCRKPGSRELSALIVSPNYQA